MHMLIAFVVVFVIAFAVIAFVESYARHLGQPVPIKWLNVFIAAAIIAFVAALIFGGIWSLFAPLFGS